MFLFRLETLEPFPYLEPYFLVFYFSFVGYLFLPLDFKSSIDINLSKLNIFFNVHHLILAWDLKLNHSFFDHLLVFHLLRYMIILSIQPSSIFLIVYLSCLLSLPVRLYVYFDFYWEKWSIFFTYYLWKVQVFDDLLLNYLVFY